MSSIRHPGSNPTERVMKERDRLFRTYCQSSHAGWATFLNKIETLFNVTPHLSTGYSPYEILTGSNPPTTLSSLVNSLFPTTQPKSLEEIRADVTRRLQSAAEQRKRHAKSYGDQLNVGDYVLLREVSVSDAANKVISKFCRLYSGPYIITDIPFPNVYALQHADTHQYKGRYNIANLKFYHRAA